MSPSNQLNKGNFSIFRIASLVTSCELRDYNVHLCVGYSIVSSIFLLLFIYTSFMLYRVILNRNVYSTTIRRNTSFGVTVSILLLSGSLVIHLFLNPTASTEFAVVAFHLLSIFIFIYSREVELLLAEPQPDNRKERRCGLVLVIAFFLLFIITCAGSWENRDKEYRCMSYFHVCIGLFEISLIPLMILQAIRYVSLVKSRMVCFIEKKNAALRSIAIITTCVLISSTSGVVYTSSLLSLGHYYGSCSVIFQNDPSLFIAIYPMHLLLRYLLPSISLLHVYVWQEITRTLSESVIVNNSQEPPGFSHFQYPAKFRRLHDMPLSDPLLNPSGLPARPAPSDNATRAGLENIPEESEEGSSRGTVRISASTQMSQLSEFDVTDIPPVNRQESDVFQNSTFTEKTISSLVTVELTSPSQNSSIDSQRPCLKPKKRLFQGKLCKTS